MLLCVHPTDTAIWCLHFLCFSVVLNFTLISSLIQVRGGFKNFKEIKLKILTGLLMVLFVDIKMCYKISRFLSLLIYFYFAEIESL